MASILTRIMLPTPPSLYVNYSSLITTAVISFIGLSEAFGSHLGYSKFFNLGSQNQNYRVKLSSRIGMLFLYTPSFLAALASLVLLLPHHKDARFLLLSLALTIHYFKRDFEVLFIHKYSGGMALGSAILISLSYFSSTAHLIYFHYKLYPTQLGKNQHDDNQQPIIDMKYIGVLLFLIGISGNFYHHFLLSKLRKNGEKEKSYKIPKGGLFGLVICPHYLFEIIEFVGICFISQTLYSFCFTIGTIFYLMGRSYATRKWYLSKFEDFPKEVLFVHKYSGSMILTTATSISISYLSSMASMIYAQHDSQGLEEPPIDLKYLGFLLFLIGIIGNFYHHYLLSQLREKGDKMYKIPQGGFFNLVICPHYLFEIIEFLGFSFISQTLHSFSIATGTMFYLLGRSFATRQWYLFKFEHFPRDVKAVIPYIF